MITLASSPSHQATFTRLRWRFMVPSIVFLGRVFSEMEPTTDMVVSIRTVVAPSTIPAAL